MGKTRKRVPLDFSWPLDTTWSGYVNTFWQRSRNCETCEGTGSSKAARMLHDRWYGYDTDPVWIYDARGLRYNDAAWCYHLDEEDVAALLAGNRLWDFTRRPRSDAQRAQLREQKNNGGSGFWLREWNGYTPTPEEVNAWSHTGLGHDGLNRSIVISAKLAKQNIAGACRVCEGYGRRWDTKEDRDAYEAWERTEPPIGEGHQLWDSEGSPVFLTLEALAQWCEENATTFAQHKAGAQRWKKMLEEDNVYHEENGNIFI